MIALDCPGCSRKLKVKDELAGKKGKCVHCGHAVQVPTPARSAALPIPDATRALVPRPGSVDDDPPTVIPDEAAPPEPADDTVAAKPALAQPTRELHDFLAPPQQPDELGRLGPYRVLKILGAGGMGVVYEAEDLQLQRHVALKAMLPTLAASGSAKQRFLREARAAAAIEHDHIVTIFQVGEDRGVPFLAMPFLKGEPLDERLKREPRPSIAEVVRIGREVAEGLVAAHERGLIHRDVKPANIWLESRGGEPATSARAGRVKILDFGLARATGDGSQLTQQGVIVGTPAYMAPEQATGQAVDGRCDLFSLGCVLYRMSTGQPPFKGLDTVSTLVAVATEEPQPPCALNPAVPTSLSELVMQLLAKKPEERPASARAVVQALRDIEEDKTVAIAAPLVLSSSSEPRVSAGGRAPPHSPGKRSHLLIGTFVLAVLSVGAFGIYRLLPTPVNNADLAQKDGNLPPGSCPADALRPEDILPDVLADAGGGDPQKAPPGLVAVLYRDTDISPIGRAVAFSPNGRLLASSIGTKTIALWDVATGKVRRVLDGHTGPVYSLAFSPDGFTLASGSQDLTVKLWEVASGGEVRTLAGHKQAVTAVAFSPDGQTLASGGHNKDRTVKLWDATNGKELRTLEGPTGLIMAVAFSPDGTLLAACAARSVCVWRLSNHQPQPLFALPAGVLVQSVTFSPDGKTLVAADANRMVQHWNTTSWQICRLLQPTQQVLLGHKISVGMAAISPDGHTLATLDGNTLGVWDAPTGQLRKYIRTTPPALACRMLAFSPEGRHVAVANNNGTLYVLRLAGLGQADDKPSVTQSKKRWVQLFDGKSLAGWKKHPKDNAHWEVKNGILLGSGGRSCLFSDRDDYENFHFRVECKINEKGGSGQYFRAPFAAASPKGGYKAQISSAPADTQKTGSLYNRLKIGHMLVPPDTWFTQEVIADGDHIIIKVNDGVTVDYSDRTFSKGHLALQQFDPTTEVQFRKVEVKELPSK